MRRKAENTVLLSQRRTAKAGSPASLGRGGRGLQAGVRRPRRRREAHGLDWSLPEEKSARHKERAVRWNAGTWPAHRRAHGDQECAAREHQEGCQGAMGPPPAHGNPTGGERSAAITSDGHLCQVTGPLEGQSMTSGKGTTHGHKAIVFRVQRRLFPERGLGPTKQVRRRGQCLGCAEPGEEVRRGFREGGGCAGFR